MVTHILTAMFRIGLFDHPLPDPATVKNTVVSTPAHLALSTKIADRRHRSAEELPLRAAADAGA